MDDAMVVYNLERKPCARKWKRMEIFSSQGSYLIMNDDHTTKGSWASPAKIETIAGAENLGKGDEDMAYFRKKLFTALDLPKKFKGKFQEGDKINSQKRTYPYETTYPHIYGFKTPDKDKI